MANPNERHPINATGRFYVTTECIDCDLCRETAPDFFSRSEETGQSFVHAQPTAPDEIAQCIEALEGCPVEAIGQEADKAP